MTNRIFKYLLQAHDRYTIQLPEHHTLLHVAMQDGTPYVWALVDTNKPLVRRLIHLYGTGHECPSEPENYLGTFQMDDGALIFHVFKGVLL